MPRRRLIAWADAQQETLLREACAAGGFDLVAVGSDAPADSAALAAALGAERVADIRAAIQRDDADVLWLASAAGLDAAALRLIDQLKRTTATSRPLPDSIGDLTGPGEGDAWTRGPRLIPLMRWSPGFLAAMDVLDGFGPAQCANITIRCGPGQGTLFSRLYDAMGLIDLLCEEPEAIDAALASPLTGVPEALGSLHGHMCINLRFRDNRCACIAASDLAGSWFRGVTILGEGGCLRISDGGFEWIANDGSLLESHLAREDCGPGALAGAALRRLADRSAAPDPLPHTRLLGLCEAARLSCRTGEPEAPHKVLKMLARP